MDVLSDSTPAVGAFTRGYSLKYSVNQSVGKVEEAFPGLDAAFWHIDGSDNIDADALSRKGFLTWEQVHGAPERVRRLIMGVSSSEGKKSIQQK